MYVYFFVLVTNFGLLRVSLPPWVINIKLSKSFKFVGKKLLTTDISPAISKVVSHQLPTSGPHLRSGHKGFVDKVTWAAFLWVSWVPLPILILLASPY